MKALLSIAAVCFVLTGCRAATPDYHLPQGYSETYRQILQDAHGDREMIHLPSAAEMQR